MSTIIFLGVELDIYSTRALSDGYGQKKITVDLYFCGEYRKFTATTSNMSDYDEATELEGSDRDEALFCIISGQIEDEVNEWILEIENR